MVQAIETLSQDAATELLLVLGKPPEPAAMKKVLEQAARCAKPVVIHFVGARAEDIRRHSGEHPHLYPADSLAEAGRLAVSLTGGRAPARTPEINPETREKIAEWSRVRAKERRFLRGVYTGGTLCAEAQAIIGRTVPGIRSNAPLDKAGGKMADPMKSQGHAVVDMGDDLFTRGKPHPMIEPDPRSARILQEAGDPETAVVLFDVVLGLGAHENPAGEAAGAIESARALESRRFVHRLRHGDGGRPTRVERTACPAGRGRGPGGGYPRRGVSGRCGRTRGACRVNPKKLLEGVRVANIGVELFSESLVSQNAPVVQVDWRPPAGGDPDMTRSLDRLNACDAANDIAIERLQAARPVWVDLSVAIDAIPGMGERTLLHSGPPIAWERMSGPPQGRDDRGRPARRLGERCGRGGKTLRERRNYFRALPPPFRGGTDGGRGVALDAREHHRKPRVL